MKVGSREFYFGFRTRGKGGKVLHRSSVPAHKKEQLKISSIQVLGGAGREITKSRNFFQT